MFFQPWQGVGDYDLFITFAENEMRRLADFYHIDWTLLTTDPAKHLDDSYFCFASLTRKKIAIIPFLSIAFGGMYTDLPMEKTKYGIVIDYQGKLSTCLDVVHNQAVINPFEFAMEEFQFSANRTMEEDYDSTTNNESNEKQEKTEEIEKCVCIEHERIAQFDHQQKLQRQHQDELIIALEKRSEVASIVNQRKKIIKKIVIIIVCILIVVWGYDNYQKDEYRKQSRNMATEEMEVNFSNVYVDVVSIEPVHFVYRYDTYKGVKINPGSLMYVVCRCKTVEGKYIWASIFYQYYPDGNYSKAESSYKKKTYSFSEPMRLTGSIRAAKMVAKGLEEEVGNEFVLSVRELSKNLQTNKEIERK